MSAARLGMHFSLWAPRWEPASAEAALAEAARYGIGLVEIPLLAPETIDVPHARALLAAHGVSPSASLCLPERAMAQRDPEAALAFLLPAIEAAAALGCSFLGGVTYSALGYRSGLPPTEAEYDNIARALRPAARRAAALGVTLGLEPCNRYETHLLNTAAQARALIARIGEPNLTVHLDTYHMNIEEKGTAAAIRAAPGASAYIHLSESDRGVPGTANVDWRGLFAALAQTGFTGDLVVESFVTLPPEIAAVLAVWRPVAPDRFAVLDEGVGFLRALAAETGLALR